MYLARTVLVRIPCRTSMCRFSALAHGENMAQPHAEGVDKPVNLKIDTIANSIATLNLLEIAELSSLLKKKLNLPESAFVPNVAFSGTAPAPHIDGGDEEPAAPKKLQTSFKVKLVKFDDKQKVLLIKTIKTVLEGMNLVQAKKFVESAPMLVKENIPKDEAEKLKEALTNAGAVVEIE